MATKAPMATRAPEPSERVVLNEVTAVISSPSFGLDDKGLVGLRFEAYIDETTCALQILDTEIATELIRASGVSDIYRLQGYPVIVQVREGTIIYLRPWQANGPWNRRTVARA